MASYLKNSAFAAIIPVVLIMMSFSGKAAAETATDDVEVYAGLAPVLELVCSDVKFGVWRVPVRTSGDVTLITLTADNVVAVTGNAAGVAKSEANDAEPAAGNCTFTGSSAEASEDGMVVTMVVGGSQASVADGNLTNGAMVPTANNEYAGLLMPVSSASLGFSLSFPQSAAIGSDGSGSFKITGILTIPETIIAANYGAYKQAGVISVTIDDSVGD